jgi:glycine betaine catabolism B
MSKLTLINKIIEDENVITLHFKSDKKINYQSGYYTRLFIPSLLLQFHKPAREITIASAPFEDNIMFSINTKSNSLFQQKIKNIQIGDQVHMIRNSGHIALPSQASKIVMIAQGVGITPFRSMILDSFHSNYGHRITLIHVNNGKYLYQDELSKFDFEQHRIKRSEFIQTLQKTISINQESTFYIGGSTDFVQSVNKTLIENGINNSKIQLDKFKGLKE